MMSGLRGFSVEQSWGVGSLRLCAGFPGNALSDDETREDKTYFVPLGSQIVCWDIEKKERKICFQAHSDLIICLEYNPNYGIILSLSYSGEIKLWSKDFKLLLSKKTNYGNTHYGAWSNDGQRFLICGGPWKTSLLTVYEISKVHNGQFNFSMSWQYVGLPMAIVDGITNSILDVGKDKREQENNGSVTYIDQTDGYIIAQFTSKDRVLAVFERYHGNASEVHLLDANGVILHSTNLDPLGNPKASIMCTTPCHNGTFAVGFQGGVFVVLNEEDLTMKSIFQATGSPQVALWDRDYILAVSYLSGIFSWWTTDGICVQELKGGPKDSVMHLNWISTSSHNALWVAGIMALFYVDLVYAKDDEVLPSNIREKYSLKYHEVTGCGFDLSSSNLAASGDFTGNVFVWKKGCNEPLFRTKHETAIRSLVWKDDKLFIGCLDGLIMKWTPSNVKCNADICVACAGGVLSLRWLQNKLAIGLENGYLLLYTFTDEDYSDPVEIINQKAHSQTRNGIVMPAEIWSVCWSPCGKMVATASEDQTTCIWDASTGNKLQTLHGHTTAVTSVDWKTMHESNKNILATCADDRTARIIDGISFEIIHVLKLQNIEGWFTLTYLSLNPINQQCLCSTEKGHLVLWDCVTGNELTCYKMHCGSIEGLAWSQDFCEFGTVSSDCVVNIFSMKHQ